MIKIKVPKFGPPTVSDTPAVLCPPATADPPCPVERLRRSGSGFCTDPPHTPGTQDGSSGSRLLGFTPDDVGSAPATAIEFVASQVDATAVDLDGYLKRRQTRWDHATEDTVFVRTNGAPLDNRAVQHLIDNWLRAAGVAPPPGEKVHAFRHTYEFDRVARLSLWL